MKKIGILTFHKAHNYGASLQVYALYEVLKNNYNVNVINYYNNYVYDQYKLFKPPSKNILRWLKINVLTFKNYRKKKARYDSFEKFIKNRLKLTKVYNDITIKNSVNDFPCVITGSDQVWSIGTVGELSDIYTLNYLPQNINKISYAASVGDSNDINKYSNEFKKKLSKINHISVREEDAKEKISCLLDKEIFEALDPTMLLNKEEWNERIKEFCPEKGKYILAYVVAPNEEYIKIVNEISRKTGLKVIHFELKNPGYKNVYKSSYKEGPLSFVNYIRNAEYIVTTSFHGTVFSIIFNKKFWVIPHNITGNRVKSLLSKLGILDRAITSFNEFVKRKYNENINWNNVNILLEKERKKSIQWLFDSIDKKR